MPSTTDEKRKAQQVTTANSSILRAFQAELDLRRGRPLAFGKDMRTLFIIALFGFSRFSGLASPVEFNSKVRLNGNIQEGNAARAVCDADWILLYDSDQDFPSKQSVFDEVNVIWTKFGPKLEEGKFTSAIIRVTFLRGILGSHKKTQIDFRFTLSGGFLLGMRIPEALR